MKRIVSSAWGMLNGLCQANSVGNVVVRVNDALKMKRCFAGGSRGEPHSTEVCSLPYSTNSIL